LTRMKAENYDPNFWISKPYLELSNVEIFENDQFVWVQEGEICLFPPLVKSKKEAFSFCDFQNLPIKKIWSDFFGSENFLRTFMKSKPLDWEYIYMPSSFTKMTGRRWAAFRKNSRKWKRGKSWEYTDSISSRKELSKLLGEWLDDKSEVIQDPKIIIEYILGNPLQVKKKFLYDGGKLVGVNAWDENYKYINYRFCIRSLEEPYLDEFLRLLLYLDISKSSNKKVNDGGTLDSLGLERFKDKLNPWRKRKVNSWYFPK